LLGELRDYTIGILAFAPLGIGAAIYMTGAQRDVENALENGEFNYIMQPMIDLRTATIAGVDAKS